ncbi:hypothetical protein DRQ25_16455 [Candidatus Fermentibacteria bacterium]|nr:MAG: hypothetical protein DRQ25_16455 [Candidatus Fermentibacteria bacterium]
MAYKKGHKKVGGRQKGTPNKNAETMLVFVEYILNKGKGDIDKIWKGLKEKEKMDAIVKLLDFQLPKHARIENVNKVPQSVTINFLPATPERIEENNTIDIPYEEADDK